MQTVHHINNIGHLSILQKTVSTPSGKLVHRYHIAHKNDVAGWPFGSGYLKYKDAFDAAIQRLCNA